MGQVSRKGERIGHGCKSAAIKSHRSHRPPYHRSPSKIAFLIGSLMLFNRADPLFRLSLNYIIPATLVTAAFFVFVIGKGLRAQLLPVKVGAGTLIGKTVTALTPIDSRSGRIFVEGEYWNAISDTPIEKDEQAEISAVQGLTVKVKTKGK